MLAGITLIVQVSTRPIGHGTKRPVVPVLVAMGHQDMRSPQQSCCHKYQRQQERCSGPIS